MLMNVNGSRFHLLLGRADWGRCLDSDRGDARELGSWWDAAAGSPPTALDDELPHWDSELGELRLKDRSIEEPKTPGETPLSLDARRCASADRHGNIYRIGDDSRSLRVSSAGSGLESTFWPVLDPDCPAGGDCVDFAPPRQAVAPSVEKYLALAVTEDHYLVVAFERGAARGLLAFDLFAGGPPVETLWPQEIPFQPFDMSPRCGGGVWVLDREPESSPRRCVLWELDRRLAVLSRGPDERMLEPQEPDDFQPVSGASRTRPARNFPMGYDLLASPATLVDPIAVETLGDGKVLVLDRDQPNRRSRVVHLTRKDDRWQAQRSGWLDKLAHDFVLGWAYTRAPTVEQRRLFIATETGNQALSFALENTKGDLSRVGATELFPLRRFAGRALIAVCDRGRLRGYYDSGADPLAWVPIAQQPRTRYNKSAALVTRVLDSGELQTTWDRVLIDACLPADTWVEIESRASDECFPAEEDRESSPPDTPRQVIGPWLAEPRPQLRSTGPELPWLRAEAARRTRREAGVGTWELLLQQARGRYLQLRIRLRSNHGITSPRVRALRAWYARFSYPLRFLPAVYREDPVAGRFLERWLANMESTLTGIEDRVATAQALFDPRAAPAEALEWLADWFDVAFDPAWDEARQRLFVRRALDFFRWRGTVHGLRLALTLAFDRCVDEKMFDGPAALAEHPQAIRIVETYLTRAVGALAAGDPGADPGPREVRREALWSPAEGNAGLVDRYFKILGRKPTPAEELEPFKLVPPSGDDAARAWRQLSETALGFVPGAGAVERTRWQGFLRARHTQDKLKEHYGVDHNGIGNLPLPRDWPQSEVQRKDWRDFCAVPDGSWARGRWQDFLARRYRRIERLQRAHQTTWPGFELVALPDVLPATAEAQSDWLQFERQLLAMHRTAHRFSVLLPVRNVTEDPFELDERLRRARRIVEIEKPAHTVFDVRLYWALNRVGEARLGIDTLLNAGSRAPELIPDAVLGRAYIGASFVGGPKPPRDGDRRLLAC
jgi:phage tail-like protein